MIKIKLILLIFCAAILASSNARLTNLRDQIPKQFELLARTAPNHQHEFRIALKQRNISILEDTLLDVSNPGSKNYGQWWTTDKILDLIAPSEASIRPVTDWLKSSGVTSFDVSGRDFIKVTAPVHVIESMFSTKLFNFKSKVTGRIYVRAYGAVHVPDHLDVIDMVTGLTELVPIDERESKRQGPNDSMFYDPLGVLFPGLVRAMYDIPSTFPVHPNSSFGFGNFQDDQAVLFTDLTKFNQKMNANVTLNGYKIVGFFNGASETSTMAVQFGGAVALNTTLWYWTVDHWLYDFATELFVAKSHPLVLTMYRGWPEDLQCEITARCTVNSTLASHEYVNRVNVEFAKLGLKGITLLAASGDFGAPGQEFKKKCSGGISNTFPASSPWVTSVGATMLVTDPHTKNLTLKFPPICSGSIYRCARTKSEGTCMHPRGMATLTSGGGFSNVSATPGWQKYAVRKYLDSGVKLPHGHFDPTKRGYPDVAANGHYYVTYFQGNSWADDRSAISSSIFGAMISLLNSVMLNHHKHSLGFINPLLYKMAADEPKTFTDITTGDNYCAATCCGNIGYVAAKGWDPVTGLGTPVFSKMQSYIQKVLVDGEK